jgi:hypothetical protein
MYNIAATFAMGVNDPTPAILGWRRRNNPWPTASAKLVIPSAGSKKIPLPQLTFSRALRAFPLVALPIVATMMLLECESSRSDHSVLWLAALSRFL